MLLHKRGTTGKGSRNVLLVKTVTEVSHNRHLAPINTPTDIWHLSTHIRKCYWCNIYLAMVGTKTKMKLCEKVLGISLMNKKRHWMPFDQNRPLERPQVRWDDDIKQSLIGGQSGMNNWQLKARDRDEWKHPKEAYLQYGDNRLTTTTIVAL